MSINTHPPDWLPGFPVREAPLFVWPACPSSCNLLSILFTWVTKATVHSHFQEKRPAVTSRDDRSHADLGHHLTTHQRYADVTLLRYLFQGQLARARLSSNQECDQVNLWFDLITHSNHIMGGKPGKGYILWGTLYLGAFWLWHFPPKWILSWFIIYWRDLNLACSLIFMACKENCSFVLLFFLMLSRAGKIYLPSQYLHNYYYYYYYEHKIMQFIIII